MRQLFLRFSFTLVTTVMSLGANTVAYIDPTNQASIGDTAGNIALLFDVNTPISVTSLGVFTASGSGAFTTPVEVVIYNTGTNAPMTPIVTFLGSYTPAGFGFDVFQSIAPVTLG